MNTAVSICSDNLPVKEGLFVPLTNGCPTALLIGMRVFASNVRFWPAVDRRDELHYSTNHWAADLDKNRHKVDAIHQFNRAPHPPNRTVALKRWYGALKTNLYYTPRLRSSLVEHLDQALKTLQKIIVSENLDI